MSVDTALADMSIEQIEAHFTSQSGETPDTSEEGAEDLGNDESAEEQDVTASSGQADEAGKAEEVTEKKGSDKEINFAKLRTKTEALERDLEALREENKRLAEARTYHAELPEDHAQKLAEIDTRLEALGEAFQDGDLPWNEYQKQQREANMEREQLVAAGLKAQISAEMREQAQQKEEQAVKATWDETCQSFIGTKPDGVDYSTEADKFRDLNTYVKALAADPDNGDKDYDWFLTEAHTLVRAKHGISAGAKPQAEQPEVPAKPPAGPIHTLSDLPGGSPVPKSEVEQLETVSGAALTNRFLADPASIDKLIASLG